MKQFWGRGSCYKSESLKVPQDEAYLNKVRNLKGLLLRKNNEAIRNYFAYLTSTNLQFVYNDK